MAGFGTDVYPSSRIFHTRPAHILCPLLAINERHVPHLTGVRSRPHAVPPGVPCSIPGPLNHPLHVPMLRHWFRLLHPSISSPTRTASPFIVGSLLRLRGAGGTPGLRPRRANVCNATLLPCAA